MEGTEVICYIFLCCEKFLQIITCQFKTNGASLGKPETQLHLLLSMSLVGVLEAMEHEAAKKSG